MASSHLTLWIGYSAAVIGSLLMLPQVFKSWRTGRVDELALTMILLYDLSCLLWVIYGLQVHSGPLILANGVGLLLGTAQLALKLSLK